MDRPHPADGVIPSAVWIVLFFTAGLAALYVLFFADSGESAVSQGVMAGSVAAVMVASLLLLAALDRPYRSDVGRLLPVAMERTLSTLDEARTDLDLQLAIPCNEVGQ